METNQIEGLLERYLHLLNEYTTLRAELNSLQTSIYQNIARANFSAERGMRFGQDFYDDRMQASRMLAVTSDDQSLPTFSVSKEDDELKPSDTAATATPEMDQGGNAGEAGNNDKRGENIKPVKKQKKDPLRWFGLITPMSLRQAQAQSIKAIEEAIPRLVAVNAKMAYVEIEVRRARKKRAKAEAAAQKQEQDGAASKQIVA